MNWGRQFRCILVICHVVVQHPSAWAGGNEKKGRTMAPDMVNFDLEATGRRLVFSMPLYHADSVEETPYQWLQVCAAGSGCKTLADLRGVGALTMPGDTSLGLSPDRRYVLCLRMVAVDVASRSYRQHYYVIYDLVSMNEVGFRTAQGKAASTDNIQGWARNHPHALEITAGRRQIALAFPP